MESRVMGNCHARFGAGENLEMISKSYLSLKVSTPQATVGVAHIKSGIHLFTGNIPICVDGMRCGTAEFPYGIKTFKRGAGKRRWLAIRA